MLGGRFGRWWYGDGGMQGCEVVIRGEGGALGLNLCLAVLHCHLFSMDVRKELSASSF